MEKELYIEDKKIKSVSPSDVKTPLGGAIFDVTFEDDTTVKMTEKKFIAMQSEEKSDATAARAALCKDVGQQVYGLLMEYGIKFSEIDPCLNESVRLINDGQNAALDILWGNEAYDRSLLDVNRVLLEKYGEKDSETEEDGEGDDGAASDGSPVDTEDKEQV